MSLGSRLGWWFKHTGIEIAGWTLVVVGIAALVLPGPGLLMMFAGLALLSQHFTWAQKLVEPIEIRAKQAAAEGVKTWPRVFFSSLVALWVFICGFIWWGAIKVTIPEFSILGYDFGPELPFAGWATGLSLIISAFIAWGLIIYSVKHFRDPV